MRVSEPVDDETTSSGGPSDLDNSQSQSQGGDDSASSSGSDSEEAQVRLVCVQAYLDNSLSGT